MPDLDPRGTDVRLDPLRVRTPGLAGTVELTGGASARVTRSAAPADQLIAPALERSDVRVQHELSLSALRRVPTTAAVTRSARGEPAIRLEVPDVAEGWEQMVLATDEAGVATWHFAPPPVVRGRTVRGAGARRTYHVRIPSPAPPPAAGTRARRGVLGVIGRAVVRVLAFKLLDAALGEVGERFAARWEQHHRPYRVRSFAPGDYTAAEAPSLAAADWERLQGGPALLFVHGTFSRAHTGFGRLPAATLTDLHRRYDGRVFAFDHYTLSEDPLKNVEWLVRQLPEAAQLELDVVAHSRGGLVARTLTELQSAVSLGSRSLAVRRTVFAGTPNAGTVLANPRHFGDLIDTYTTLLSFVPDNGVTDVLETIVTVAKTIAVGVLEGLDGLTSMRPGGDFLQQLNAGGRQPSAHYFALASDYEPGTRALREWARDRLMDALFHVGNDLVVPADGVWAANGSARFPLAAVDRHVFGHADGVAHSGYFVDGAGSARLLAWLPG